MIKEFTTGATLHSEVVLAPEKRTFEYNLEALRGLAALMVVWCHAIGIKNYVDPHYNPSGPLAYQVPAHLSVILFFVLSGYVIGITNKTPLTGSSVGTYLKKRFVRIYPIYAVAMLLTLAVAAPYPLTTWLAHFSLTQVLLAPVIFENSPSWSLHYEVLYYLLFVPLSMCRVNAWVAAAFCTALGIGNLLLMPTNTLLTAYSFGFTFWLCGLGLARKSLPTTQFSYQFLMSMMLLLLSMRNFNYFASIVEKAAHLLAGNRLFYLPGTDEFRAIIYLADFGSLPLSMACILLFTSKDFPFRRYVVGFLFVVPAATFLYLAKSYKQIDLDPFVMSTLFYVLAVVLVMFPMQRIEDWSARLMRQLVKVGSISYALYIIHFPIMAGLKRIDFFSGSGLTYSVRFLLLMALSFAAAELLEKKFQPFVRGWFFRPKAEQSILVES